MSRRPYYAPRGGGGGGRGGGGGQGNWRGGGRGHHPYSQQWSSSKPRLDKIEHGSTGLIFTMEVTDERQGVREAMNLVDNFLHKLEKTKSSEATSGGEASSSPAKKSKGEAKEKIGGRDYPSPAEKEKDISDVLTELCEQTKQQGSSIAALPGEHRVRQLDIGTKHTIFLSIDNPTMPATEIYRLVDAMLEECQREPRCRFLSRCIPVEDVCSAAGGVAALSSAIPNLVERHVKLYTEEVGMGGFPPSYAVEFRMRNSNVAINKEEVYKVVADAMTQHSPGSRVNLTAPDLHLLVNVYRNQVMLSCARRYLSRRSYSLRPPQEKDNDKTKEKSEKAPSTSSGQDAKDADEKEASGDAQDG